MNYVFIPLKGSRHRDRITKKVIPPEGVSIGPTIHPYYAKKAALGEAQIVDKNAISTPIGDVIEDQVAIEPEAVVRDREKTSKKGDKK